MEIFTKNQSFTDSVNTMEVKKTSACLRLASEMLPKCSRHALSICFFLCLLMGINVEAWGATATLNQSSNKGFGSTSGITFSISGIGDWTNAETGWSSRYKHCAGYKVETGVSAVVSWSGVAAGKCVEITNISLDASVESGGTFNKNQKMYIYTSVSGSGKKKNITSSGNTSPQNVTLSEDDYLTDIGNSGSITMYSSDQKWYINSITITYDIKSLPVFYFQANVYPSPAEGGIATVYIDDANNPSATASASVTGGKLSTSSASKKAAFNAKANTGFHFLGWGTSANSTTYESTNNPYEPNLSNTSDGSTSKKSLYAIFAPNTYNIVFNANGGSGSMSNLAMTYGTSKTLTANSFTRTGYTFNGWNTAANGSGTSYIDGQNINNLTTTNNATITLYAQWVANSYTVNFNANEGNVSTASKSVTYDATYGDLPVPTRSGYTFAGWFTEESTGTQIAASTKVEITDAQTLYAHWLANYSVKFNANGGNGSMTDQAFVEGTAQNLTANAFTRTGYTFAGWATSADGSVVYTNGQNVNNLTTTGNDVINLYAKWNVHTYAVAFDGNGSTSGSMDNQAFAYDEDAKSLTANAFAKSYTVRFDANGGTCSTTSLNGVSPFLGWATSANGEKVYDDEQSVRNLTAENNATFNLYAKWGVGSIVLPAATGETNLDHLEGWFNGDEKVGDAGSAYTPTSDMELTARWTREQLTPSFGGENTPLKVGAEQTSAFSFNNTEGPVAHIDVTAIDAINDGSGKVIEYDAATNTIIARNAGTATIYFTQAETEAVKADTSATWTYTVTKNDPSFTGSDYNDLMVDDVQTADYAYSNTSALTPSASADDDFYFTVDDVVFVNAETNKGENLVTYNPATKEITANNAGTGKITLRQKETYKYNAGSASYAVMISKYTPSFSGSAYNDLMVDGVQTADYAYSNTSAAKPSASADDDFYFTVDDVVFVNAETNNGDALVTYDPIGNGIVANNAGIGKITLRQKETYKYNAGDRSFAVTISKYTPEFSGSAYNDLMVDGVQTADYTYSNTSAAKPSASADDDFYYSVDDIEFANAEKNNGDALVTYDPIGNGIVANNAGTGKITLRQKETYKYNAGDQSFGVTVSKYTPEFSGSDYTNLKVDDILIVDYIYSNTSATKPSASEDDDFYFSIDEIVFDSVELNKGNALVTYDPVGNGIVANNAGTGKITLRQKETYKYNAGDQSFAVTISKYTPSFTWNAPASYYHNTTVDNIFATTNSDCPYTITSSDATIAYVEDNILHVLTKASSATFTITQEENYKWNSKTEQHSISIGFQSNHVPFTVSSNNNGSFLLTKSTNTSWDSNGYKMGNDSWNYNNAPDCYVILSLSGIPDKLTFTKKCDKSGIGAIQALPVDGQCLFEVYESATNDSWGEPIWSYNKKEESRDVTDVPQLKATTRYIKLRYYGTCYGHFNNIKVTERKQFDVTATSIDFDTNYIKSNCASKTFDINYANAGHKVTLTVDDPAFSVSPTEITTIGGEKVGTYTPITVSYSTANEHTNTNATLTVQDELGNKKTITLKGKTVKYPQSLSWTTVSDAITYDDEATVLATNSVDSMQPHVYYVSSDSTVIDVNGAQLIAKKVGKATITAKCDSTYMYYAATSISKEIEVKKIVPVLTAPTAANEITYGQTLASVGLNDDGSAARLNETDIPGTYAWQDGSQVLSAGTHNDIVVVFTPEDSTIYATNTATISVTVNKKALTVTADNKTVTYGDAAPEYSVAYDGFIEGESAANLGGELAFDCAYAVGSAVSTYDITPKGLTSDNYAITFTKGTLTVNKAALTITADNKAVTYGDAAPEYTVSYAGFVAEDDANALGGELAFACEYEAGNGVGEYDITASGLTSDNYTIDFVGGKLTINKAALTITAENKEVTYGAEAPAFTVAYDGWKGTDEPSVLTGELTFACEYEAGKGVGAYTITPSGLEAVNYEIAFTAGTLTVNKAASSAVAPAAIKNLVYSGAAQTLIAEGSAQGGELQYSLDGESWSTDLLTGTDAGVYTVYYKVVGDANHNDIAVESIEATIGQKAFTVTAKNESVTYGDAKPDFSVSYEGFAGEETEAVLGGELAYACTYAAGSAVGTYDIIPSGLTSGNYEITFHNGTLSVGQKALTVKADDKAVTYGDASPTYTASYDGFVNAETAENLGGELAFACEYAQGSVVNTYAITPSGLTSDNYAIEFVGGTLTVNKAASSVTAPTAVVNLVYNGEAQTLINEGSAQGGELQYSLNNADWSEELPTGTDAGVYTVYYKVVGDANHTDIAAASLNVTIDYTIAYNLAGGNVAEANPTHYNAETATFTLNSPTREHYTFAGWTGSNGEEPQTEVTIAQGATGNRTYTANWTVNKYTITWLNADNSLIEATEVEYGAMPEHAAAEKAATAQYTYTFKGWTPALAAVTGNATYKAEFDSTVNVYTIIFQNADGTELQKSQLAYGETPVYAGEQPTKEADAQNTYAFAGWDADIVAVTGNATYTATFSSTVNKYTITWLNADESLIDETEVEYGAMPEHAAAEKAATAQYTYTFKGWTPALAAVTGNATYKAEFDSTVNVYTIIFQNADGTELQKSQLAYGETPVYAGETPTKEADAQNTYAFAGWDAEIVAVTGNATYTATFNSTVNKYTITWLNADESLIDETEVEYGAMPAHADAEKAATAQYTYTFKGWTPALAAVTGNATYKAEFDSVVNVYTVIFQNADGTELQKSQLAYGETPVYEGEQPTKEADAQNTYAFAGWDAEIAALTGNATYTATFSSTVNKYTITWLNADESLIDETEVEYGAMPEHAAAEKAATAQYTYTFKGWTPALAEVTGAATYKAEFDSTVNVYTVIFQNADGTELQKSQLAYGETPVYEGEQPTKEADEQYTYTFATWTPEIVAVTGEATYTATFNSQAKIVEKQNQIIVWEVESLGSIEVGDNTLYLDAYTAELAVYFTSSDSTIAYVDANNYVVALKAGEVTITARQDGNETYKAAEPVSKTLTVVAKENQGGHDATAVEDVNGDKANGEWTKVLRGNQVFIIRGDKTYTAQGQLVN